MGFNTDTLQPTYKLEWGVLGNSNALAVAQSIGFDRKVVASARNAKQRLLQFNSSSSKQDKIAGALLVRLLCFPMPRDMTAEKLYLKN